MVATVVAPTIVIEPEKTEETTAEGEVTTEDGATDEVKERLEELGLKLVDNNLSRSNNS